MTPVSFRRTDDTGSAMLLPIGIARLSLWRPNRTSATARHVRAVPGGFTRPVFLTVTKHAVTMMRWRFEGEPPSAPGLGRACWYRGKIVVVTHSEARTHGSSQNKSMIHSTTILAVRHRDRAVMAGDGQVTFGQTVVKQNARKIRRLYNDKILAGFAGSAADSFALFSRFESKLEQYRGNLERSAVELAKDWRTDRILRRLEAMLIVLDKTTTFLLSGNGDLIEPDDGIVAIGSGGPYALAAAKALANNTDLDAHAIAEKAMAIAGEICIYTNAKIALEEL